MMCASTVQVAAPAWGSSVEYRRLSSIKKQRAAPDSEPTLAHLTFGSGPLVFLLIAEIWDLITVHPLLLNLRFSEFFIFTPSTLLFLFSSNSLIGSHISVIKNKSTKARKRDDQYRFVRHCPTAPHADRAEENHRKRGPQNFGHELPHRPVRTLSFLSEIAFFSIAISKVLWYCLCCKKGGELTWRKS